MRCSGLARSCGAVPPISQRPLRRSTTFRAQQPCLWSGCPDHRLALGLPRAGWPGNYPSPKTLSFPKAQRFQVFPVPWLRAFFRRMTRGFPQGQATQVFPSPRVAQSFLFAAWLGVSPPPVSSKFSLCRWRRTPPGPKARICPLPGGAGLFLGQRPRNYPLPVARGFPRAGWLGVSSSPVAPGSSLPEDTDLPFAGWLGVSPLPVARGFPFAGYRPGGRRISTPIAGTAQGVSGSNFKILWPSTSHPQLTPGCPPRRDFLHRTLHRTIHRRVLTGRGAGQPSAG